VKDSLKELVYGVCVLFAIGFVISFSTALCSSCLLHKERKRRRMGARVRTQGEGSMNTNSATTQTQESSFTIPVTWSPLNARAADSCQTPRYIRERQTHVEMSPISIQSTTVSTQTPMFMMPVAQLVYDIQERRGDYSLGLLVSGRDDPPPPYSAAVSR